jgi:hypothetical protein
MCCHALASPPHKISNVRTCSTASRVYSLKFVPIVRTARLSPADSRNRWLGNWYHTTAAEPSSHTSLPLIHRDFGSRRQILSSPTRQRSRPGEIRRMGSGRTGNL